MDDTARTPSPAARRRYGLGLAARLLRGLRRPSSRLFGLARGVAANMVLLGITAWVLPGIHVNGPLALLRLVVLVSLVGAVLRPLLIIIAVALGGIAVLVLGLVAQGLIVYVAIRIDPGVSVDSPANALAAAWSMAVMSAIGTWLSDAGSDDAFLGQIVRQLARSRDPITSDAAPGLLIIQLDGLSAPLLRWSVVAGNLPNLGRWVRTGSHTLREWHTGLPSTTPAAQAGLLHGASRFIPAFRWYEKDTGRLMVTNRPGDAAEIERRISDGRGLLADGGVSISNVFSGDAPLSLITMSSAGLPSARAPGYSTFVASPHGFARALVLTIGEMAKEIQQARRQRRRGIEPRVKRGASYVLLRGITNVLLRDLNVSLIAEQMARGAPVIFCDFVDYDEVAHHAGPTRPESLQTLEGLDRVVGTLERLSTRVGRRYEIVVLSDHGQSQGATFRQRWGMTLDDLVHDLLGGDPSTAHATGRIEDFGPVNALLTELAARPSKAATLGRRAMTGRRAPGDVAFGPHEDVVVADGVAELIVIASGNLAMVSLPRHPGQLTLEHLRELYPRLLPGLAAHPGIGFVVARSAEHGPVAIGAQGTHVLDSGTVDGRDPLAGYGQRAAADLAHHQSFDHIGDLVIVSAVDAGTGEVAAFEELVGCHGGLGGDQTRAMLLHPVAWPVTVEPLSGPDAVHHQLVQWLRDLGLRRDEPSDDDHDTEPLDTQHRDRPADTLASWT